MLETEMIAEGPCRWRGPFRFHALLQGEDRSRRATRNASEMEHDPNRKQLSERIMLNQKAGLKVR
jgi:hypothetical protein